MASPEKNQPDSKIDLTTDDSQTIGTIDQIDVKELPDNLRSVVAILRPFELDNKQLTNIKEQIIEEMKTTLNDRTNIKNLRMSLSHIGELPNGTEKGHFFVLEVGSFDFRLLIVDISGGTIQVPEQETFPIAPELATGSLKTFFVHVAYCITQFLTLRNMQKDTAYFAISFAYPLELHDLQSAFISHWTKHHLRCTDFSGQDIGKLLLESLASQGTKNVVLISICNDVSAVLMYCARLNTKCCAAVVVGTGTNGAYIEQTSKINNLKTSNSKMIVVTEWGHFGDQRELHSIQNEFDRALDANSIQPLHCIFEKLVSATHMTELFRLVIIKCVRQNLLFGGILPEGFQASYGIKPTDIAGILEKHGENMTRLKSIFQHLGVSDPSNDEIRAAQIVVKIITIRSAYLVAAAIAALVTKVGKKHVAIGLSGSLLRFFPHYSKLVKKKLKELINPNVKIELVVQQGAVGKGAALVGAVAVRMGIEGRFGHKCSPACSFSSSTSLQIADKLLQNRNDDSTSDK